ncbi:unnamed protein product [Brugia pahangi]|uniref:Secreted protein n=1 Tax=Brugia pahangi TaxID=6280 RepID=A0A0N4TLH1_BRUPA|nr:unnamed protein product [Brugia pahangi]
MALSGRSHGAMAPLCFPTMFAAITLPAPFPSFSSEKNPAEFEESAHHAHISHHLRCTFYMMCSFLLKHLNLVSIGGKRQQQPPITHISPLKHVNSGQYLMSPSDTEFLVHSETNPISSEVIYASTHFGLSWSVDLLHPLSYYTLCSFKNVAIGFTSDPYLKCHRYQHVLRFTALQISLTSIRYSLVVYAVKLRGTLRNIFERNAKEITKLLLAEATLYNQSGSYLFAKES